MGAWRVQQIERVGDVEYFEINRSGKYVIYGAGGNSRHIKNLFQSARYDVIAVLDKRADEIHNMDEIPVYTLEKFSLLGSKKEEITIVISVKNVFEHINIVRELLELGYKNIIYKPFPVLQGESDEEWGSIDQAYEMIVEKKELSFLEGKRIACSRQNHLMIFKDELLIEEGDDTVMCRMPIELLCNYDREDAFGLIPLASYYPLVNMYQYLLGLPFAYEWEEIKNDFFLYSANWVERSGNEFSEQLKNSMIDSRVNVFYGMKRNADIRQDFFVQNAVSVKRTVPMRFYLSTSGRNRVAFQIAKGNRYVPVHMNKKDYVFWKNQSAFEALERYLNDGHINKLFASVPHPLMVSYGSDAIDYIPLFCMPVIKEIYRLLHWKAAEKGTDYPKLSLVRYNEEKQRLKVFAAVSDEGCIGRLLLMNGISCCRMYYDKKQKTIGRLLDELFYLKDSDAILTDDHADMIHQCQVLIVDSRMAETIEDFRGNIIFVLQWGNEGYLGSRQDTYTEKKLLFQTIWQQNQVSGWMLTKAL